MALLREISRAVCTVAGCRARVWPAPDPPAADAQRHALAYPRPARGLPRKSPPRSPATTDHRRHEWPDGGGAEVSAAADLDFDRRFVGGKLVGRQTLRRDAPAPKILGFDPPRRKPLLGSADIKSLADLSNSFEIVESINLVPCTKETVIQLGVMAIVSIAPLVLTLIPLEDLLKKLFSILL